MPSWIGPWEIAIVVVIALLIFGPKKLPQMGQSVGRSIRGFKEGLKESQEEFKSALSEDQSAATVTPVQPAEAAQPVVTTAVAEPAQAPAATQAAPAAATQPVEAVSVEAEQPIIAAPLEQTKTE